MKILLQDETMGNGEFVWTGFDYLGEPTPMMKVGHPSSYFGINDLAGCLKTAFIL
jgi:beta-galactosidase